MCSWRVNWRTEKSLESNAACSPPGFFGVQVFQLNLAAQARRVSCMGRCYLLVGDGSPGDIRRNSNMGRPRQFNREGVLDRATISVFWKHGFANTTVQHLEEATGVNKSDLYSEFKDKEDLFLASLER